MSIATNLQELFTAREAMKTSINNKDNSIITDGAQMQDIADLIRQIGSGSSTPDPDAPGATNGKTWTRSNITSTTTGNPIYGLGVWAAGTHYSTDGKNWIACSSAGGTTVLRRYDHSSTSAGFISYNPDSYYDYDEDEYVYDSNIYYSADGKSWSVAFTVPDGSQVRGIAYNDSRYVGYTSTHTFTSTTGSSWSSKQWVTSNSSYMGIAGNLMAGSDSFIIYGSQTNGSIGLYQSTNGSTWYYVHGVGGGYDELWDFYLAPDDDLYYTVHNLSAAMESQRGQGGIYYNSTRIVTDSADIDFTICDCFNDYVYISGSYGAYASGIYKDGSKISSWGLSSAETGIKNYLTDLNDGDFLQIRSRNYSATGSIFSSQYTGYDLEAVTVDNGMYICTNGYYSTNATEWTQCEDDANKSVVFSAPPIYANGIWVAKSNRGLVYSLY